MIWNKLDTNREKSYLEKQNVQKNESRSCKQAQSSPPFDAKTCSIEDISSNISPQKMVGLFFLSSVFLVKVSFEVFKKIKIDLEKNIPQMRVLMRAPNVKI